MSDLLVGRRDGVIDMVIHDDGDPRAPTWINDCARRGGVVFRIPRKAIRHDTPIRCGSPWPFAESAETFHPRELR